MVLFIEYLGKYVTSAFRFHAELCDRFKMQLDIADFHLLSTKFDVNNNGRFSYVHFLKYFVLALQTAKSPGMGERNPPFTPKVHVTNGHIIL